MTKVDKYGTTKIIYGIYTNKYIHPAIFYCGSQYISQKLGSNQDVKNSAGGRSLLLLERDTQRQTGVRHVQT